jgi:FAD synthetase
MPKKPRTVLVGGVFDLLHLGHIHFFQEAKRHGDRLVVVVATDRTAQRLKHTTIIPGEMRVELLNALEVVDQAILGDEKDMYRSVEMIKPDVIVLGYDQVHQEMRMKRELAERNIVADILRAPKFDHDLDGTRKIIHKIKEQCKEELRQSGEN